MKHLYILRHAQALPQDGGTDKDRALSPKGKEDSRALGQLLSRQKKIPDLILCSDARRTRETCEGLLQHWDAEVHTDYLGALYDARRADLLTAVQNAPDHVTSLMLIGHNPAIHEFAAMIAHDGPSGLISRLELGYAPATLSCFDIQTENWRDFPDESCRLTDFLSPADYNSPSPARWT